MGATSLITWLTLIVILMMATWQSYASILTSNNRKNTSNRIDRLKFACVIDRFIAIKIRHGPIPGCLSFWNINDRLTNNSVNFTSINETNSLFVVFNSSESSNILYNLTNKNEWMVHRINIDRWQVGDGAKELILTRYTNQTKRNHLIIETLAIDRRSECSINHPLTRQNNNNEDSLEVTKLVKLKKNQTIRLFCSIFTRTAADLEREEHSRPIVKWLVEKPSRISLASFANQTSTFVKSASFSQHHFNYIAWTHIDYKSPADDLSAWQNHDEPIVCHIGHPNYYDGSGGASETQNIIHTVSRFSAKIPYLGCRIKLNIQFDPFVHPNVSLVQVFNETDRTALVECPIKANSHFPIK